MVENKTRSTQDKYEDAINIIKKINDDVYYSGLHEVFNHHTKELYKKMEAVKNISLSLEKEMATIPDTLVQEIESEVFDELTDQLDTEFEALKELSGEIINFSNSIIKNIDGQSEIIKDFSSNHGERLEALESKIASIGHRSETKITEVEQRLRTLIKSSEEILANRMNNESIKLGDTYNKELGALNGKLDNFIIVHEDLQAKNEEKIKRLEIQLEVINRQNSLNRYIILVFGATNVMALTAIIYLLL
ncbi:hypothetical protein K8O68_03645 [Salipaludibacillus sp. CUR1]|uniref:hypothetical protein n=1 Tax=Salipaludibacillus sp. CUR1 TaxID=2820003 RepID=UPI001E3D95AB|nr:hypothetical protein [Salipaludibacillus sp. CUR1]MCE7791518.1 hypothetical protein [Salipaludibacillus sp. CUR1]